MRAIVGSVEVHHAIDAGERGAVAAVAMRVKFLLGKNVAARL